MLRMMIVDDEKIIRETIRNIIDWNSIGIQVIGVCKNGIEAYDMILDEYPDIVLTDIKMPGLSGLELIKRITQAGQQTEFIILSGYGDYEYTKEAMKYGIKYYLLKPCSETEIMEVVQEAKKQCYRRRAKEDQEKQDFLLLKKLHESVVFNLITESLSDVPDFARLSGQYERFLSFSNVSYEACRLQQVDESERAAVLAVFYRYHGSYAPGIPVYIIHADKTLYIGFESYDYDYSRLDEFMKAFNKNYRRFSFENLNTLLPVMSKTLHTHKQMYMLTESQTVKLWSRKAMYQIAENFVAQIKNADEETYPQMLQMLSKKLNTLNEADSVRAVASNIFLNLPAQGTECRMPLNMVGFMAELNSCEDAGKVREAVLEKLKTLEPKSVNVTSCNNEFIDKTVAFVHENISDPELSLKNIAENYLYMNVDYVSKKFLKCMGCKFSAFLAQMRIEKAMQLFAEEPGMNITTVAAAVGCGNNPQYFSQLFKKNIGMTPTEYIKSIGG